MGLSQTELIKIVLPAIFGSGGIAGIVIFLIPYFRRRKQDKSTQGPIVEKTKISVGDSTFGKIENQGSMIYINEVNLIIKEGEMVKEIRTVIFEETQKLIDEIRKSIDKSI